MIPSEEITRLREMKMLASDFVPKMQVCDFIKTNMAQPRQTLKDQEIAQLIGYDEPVKDF